ncbi:MAG: hypothetical protein JJT76_10870 [Clostridiaceae bacterium]|nr:hypothetical protein [Clostridiaceae bacterium]
MLHVIVNKEGIEAIRIAVYFPNDFDENEYSQYFRIEDEKDINKAINILDNYQYKVTTNVGYAINH